VRFPFLRPLTFDRQHLLKLVDDLTGRLLALPVELNQCFAFGYLLPKF